MMRPSIMDLVVALRGKVEEVERLITQLSALNTSRVHEVSKLLVEALNKYVEREEPRVGEVLLGVAEFVLQVLAEAENDTGSDMKVWCDILFYIVSSNIHVLKRGATGERQGMPMAA